MHNPSLQKEISEQVIIRAAEPDDLKLIELTFVKGAYYGNPCFSDFGSVMYMKKDTFFEGYSKIILNLLESSTVRVACLSDSQDVALGYSVYSPTREGTILHYVYVKEAWRKLGIAKRLVPANIIAVTHTSLPGNSIRKRYRIPYNPFA